MKRPFGKIIKTLRQKVMFEDINGVINCFPLAAVKEIPFGGDRLIMCSGRIIIPKERKLVGELRILKQKLERKARK